jgi:hypothetical protein
MPRLAALLVLVLAPTLAACSLWDGDEPAASAVDMQGWRFTSGKRPSRAEYTAVVAACEQGALARTQGKPLELCLTDLGLRRE